MTYIVTICMWGVIIFLSYLNRKAHNKNADVTELKTPKVYLFMGYLVIAISLGILIIPFLMSNSPDHYPILVWLLIVVIFVFGIYIVQLHKRHKVTISEKGFSIHSIFGSKTEFFYCDITSVKINYLTYFISLKDKKGGKGRVYFHIKNFSTVLTAIKLQSGINIESIERLLKM